MRTYVCPGCRRDLPRDAFGRHAGKPDDRESYCRVCKLDRQRAYRATAAGREHANAAQRRRTARRRSGVPRGSLPAAPAAA